jgi:hypothetical protein
MKTSVKKTHYLLAVEFGWPQCGIGSEIIARICESKFESIKNKKYIFCYQVMLLITLMHRPYVSPVPMFHLPMQKHLNKILCHKLQMSLNQSKKF